LLLAANQAWLADLKVDAILPVPLHRLRLAERGFNQAVDLARPLARVRGVPLLYNALDRVRHTAPQFGLSVPQRRENIRGAFQVPRPHRVKGRRILLVDDIITTGATVAECAKVLKKAGAAQVAVLALARAG
jgi:ComF family protein